MDEDTVSCPRQPSLDAKADEAKAEAQRKPAVVTPPVEDDEQVLEKKYGQQDGR